MTWLIQHARNYIVNSGIIKYTVSQMLLIIIT